MKASKILLYCCLVVSCSSINAPHGGTTGSDAVWGNAIKNYSENSCAYCNGTGQKECIYCDGSGQQVCISCQGSGLGAMCYNCQGAGRVYNEYTGWSKCYVCNGRGYQKCYSCNGRGWNKCTYCNGRGWVKCTYCNGTGRSN